MIQEGSGAINVVSPDGTPVVAYGDGEGPPLLAVHGTGETSAFWRPLLPLLGRSFTVYAMQRRGRGKSGDSRNYSLANEGEDVAALADAIGEPVVLFGHCFGANCALEAAFLSDNVARLVLYEPRVLFPYSDGVIDELEALASRGEEEEVLLKYFVQSDLTIEELMKLRSGRDWTLRFPAAPTVPRECRADAVYQIESQKTAGLSIPTLLLAGSESSEPLRRGIRELTESLPQAAVETISGQGQTAISSAAEVVASLLGHA